MNFPACHAIITLKIRLREAGMFDLHSHSVYSDGTETPSKVVDIAKESGLSLFALTDHDSIAGVK